MQVRNGEQAELEWELVTSWRVSGSVYARLGAPAPDAEIVASWPGDPKTLRTVARTDARGRFETPPLSADCWLGARLRGRHGPLQHLGRALGQGPAYIELELDTTEEKAEHGKERRASHVDTNPPPQSKTLVPCGTCDRKFAADRIVHFRGNQTEARTKTVTGT